MKLRSMNQKSKGGPNMPVGQRPGEFINYTHVSTVKIQLCTSMYNHNTCILYASSTSKALQVECANGKRDRTIIKNDLKIDPQIDVQSTQNICSNEW